MTPEVQGYAGSTWAATCSTSPRSLTTAFACRSWFVARSSRSPPIRGGDAKARNGYNPRPWDCPRNAPSARSTITSTSTARSFGPRKTGSTERTAFLVRDVASTRLDVTSTKIGMAFLKRPRTSCCICLKLARHQTGSDALLVLTWENWKDFDHPPGRARGPEEYYDIVLQELASRCRYPGDSTPAFFACQAAAACELPTTVMLGISRQLEESNLWKIGNKDLLRYSVTPQRDAWERMANLTVRRDPSRRAFVAMWFDPSMRPAYDAIATMLQDEGYRPPFRVDAPPITTLCRKRRAKSMTGSWRRSALAAS